MKIIIAKNAGYCFGVRDAVNMAHDVAEKEGEVYMLGDIVHNERVVKDLGNSGAKVVNSLDEVPKDGTVLFRAHGTKNEVWDEAREKKMNIVDATCPLVHKIHEDVRNLYAENQNVYGDPVAQYQENVQDKVDERIRAEQHLRRIRGY